MRVRIDEMERFITIYDGTTYLKLFGYKKYDAIYNRIWYLIGLKHGIRYIFSHNFAKIKIDSYGSLSIEKRLTVHNVIIIFK